MKSFSLKTVAAFIASIAFVASTSTSAQTISRYQSCIGDVAYQCSVETTYYAADLRECTDRRTHDCDGILEEEPGTPNPLRARLESHA